VVAAGAPARRTSIATVDLEALEEFAEELAAERWPAVCTAVVAALAVDAPAYRRAFATTGVVGAAVGLPVSITFDPHRGAHVGERRPRLVAAIVPRTIEVTRRFALVERHVAIVDAVQNERRDRLLAVLGILQPSAYDNARMQAFRAKRIAECSISTDGVNIDG
jgi:hypothetical protein